MTDTYRAARLHGIGDLRIEDLPRPVLEDHEVLVQVEACGICPTDVRKFRVGVNDGSYPFNPGHEWVGRVVDHGQHVRAVRLGQRVYGDAYGGYGELAVLPTVGSPWSHGPLVIAEDLPVRRAVFVEPLADCLHALRDQASTLPGEDVLVVGAGQMGLQLVVAAAHLGACVVAVDPLPDRRAHAIAMGATSVHAPEEVLPSSGGAYDVVVHTLPRADLAADLLSMLRVGGRLVLFAGFGPAGNATLDLNQVHYRELTVVGSEWVGTPPRQRLERYREALDLLTEGGRFALEHLVTGSCTLDTLSEAFEEVGTHRSLKHILDLTGNTP